MKRRPLIPGLVMQDPWLAPYAGAIQDRLHLFDWRLKRIRKHYGSVDAMAREWMRMGIRFDEKSRKWIYREWAPSARGLWFMGDFNGWDRKSHPMKPIKGGFWEIQLPEQVLKHGDKVKVFVLGSKGQEMDRIPAWIHRAVQDPNTYDFAGQIWNPSTPYQWQHEFEPSKIKIPYIYETHVGMSGESEEVHSYRFFADEILPWIKKAQYNVIQLMAIQEHPYYGSFGYHVSSFFAPSSRFGTPDDLKYLIDKAHGLGIAVLLDVVHSHAVKNMAEGLNEFDGSGGQYFHAGPLGEHPDWDSKCFDYGRDEVVGFLLSNVLWWLEEFRFDGFRFDGVTSMLYKHRGKESFDGYAKYFSDDVDVDAVTYLQLANALIQIVKPGAFSIGEDMSGMPGLCRPIDEGGLGFTHRLTMGIPDYWIKLLKEVPDEDWNLGDMWHTLTNRRYGEAHIAYAESHDQALVGDKTLAFQLMDKDMYWNMSKDKQSLVVDRGIAFHKMIRLISLAVGGEGWLNFMGNEFGHPEWIDFPREGNNNSYKHCRRQWSLVHNECLKYEYLAHFDRSLIRWAKGADILSAPPAQKIEEDNENKVLTFARGQFFFVFNWSEKAMPGYRLKVPKSGKWQVVLNSDDDTYGGHNRVDESIIYSASPKSSEIQVYLVPRTAMVFKYIAP